MLQIDHVYEFLYQEIFKDFEVQHCTGGVIQTNTINSTDIVIFNPKILTLYKIFFYDQEPFIPQLAKQYLDRFNWVGNHSVDEILEMYASDSYPTELIDIVKSNPQFIHNTPIVATSEISSEVDQTLEQYKFHKLYYFFHGFAALDWYRGHYALNYTRPVIKPYSHDFVSYNRLVLDDRSYRIYFVSLLKSAGLLEHGQISFNVSDDNVDWRNELSNPQSKLSTDAKIHIGKNLLDIDKLVIDYDLLLGSASADIPRAINSVFATCSASLWHIVTETVFYYNKLHLTEKIFKPIASKQPFMLLAAPGNLEYLRSYGFKTFNGIIDESYDSIVDNDLRTEAVAGQIQWYCNLAPKEKQAVIERLAPIVEYNFHHFYGEFRHIITRELLDNCKSLFKEIGYNDSNINYDAVYSVLTEK